MNSDLYFLAIIPPEPIYSEVLALKNNVKEEYNSKAALKSPPHITLHMPFKLKEKRVEELRIKLAAVCIEVSTFDIQLVNFNHFGQRVIYIGVINNSQLADLQSEINRLMKRSFTIFNANHRDQGFNPHMTIAFRDLKKEQFSKAWDRFSKMEYKKSFIANELTLLKHNGVNWETYQTFRFK